MVVILMFNMALFDDFLENELIEKYKPRFIYGKSYFNKFAKESGRQKIVHYVDVGLIDKYYEKTPFEDVYELKEEFVRPCY